MSLENQRPSIAELESKARVLRRHIIEMTTAAGNGHPTSSLSATEVVTAIYFGGFLNYRADEPDWAERDRFIMSKGHAVPALYAAMAEAGYFPTEDLATLRKLGSPLEGHPNVRRLPGIEASTGSLGQGLSIGLGQALGCRSNGHDSRIFVVLGDGEMGEGQVWEAIATAHKYAVGNLTAIIDQNGFQQTGATSDVLDLTPFAPKIESFGWHVQTIPGNDMASVVDALDTAVGITDRPTAIVAETQKGFGILPILEEIGDLNFHGQALSAELAEKALAQL